MRCSQEGSFAVSTWLSAATISLCSSFGWQVLDSSPVAKADPATGGPMLYEKLFSHLLCRKTSFVTSVYAATNRFFTHESQRVRTHLFSRASHRLPYFEITCGGLICFCNCGTTSLSQGSAATCHPTCPRPGSRNRGAGDGDASFASDPRTGKLLQSRLTERQIPQEFEALSEFILD